MKRFRTIQLFFLRFVPCIVFYSAQARDITFCGERIPIENNFVATKLMNVIRSQVRTLDLLDTRRKAQRYFPIIQYYLRQCNMPDDLKYIPIIESGFVGNARSRVGAQGFWQLMPATATDWGLSIVPQNDERNDIYKSTIAAMRELARTFKSIRRDKGIASWVLTAAAYNWGIGNVYGKIEQGSSNYFNMRLNPETAVYVYKIIAVKELFEYPEVYIKNFNYNVFSQTRPMQSEPVNPKEAEVFNAMNLPTTSAGAAPEDETIKNVSTPTGKDLQVKPVIEPEARLVGARITGNYKDFVDGQEVTIRLQDDLQTHKGFQGKNTELTGKGWIVDDRVFIDLGFSSKNVILYDAGSQQGIPLRSLRNKEQVILRVQN